MRWMLGLGMAMSVALAGVASAQEFNEISNVVVTASRYAERYESVSIPHVAIKRRADFATRSLTVISDTRDYSDRMSELRAALSGLQRQASRDMALGVMREEAGESGDTRVRSFTIEIAMSAVRNGPRPDTSQVLIVVRTPVAPDDTLDTIERRFNAFIAAAPKPDRIEVLPGGFDLVLIDPAQYRGPIVEAIAADANRAMAALGDGYGARLESLENAVAWRRAGDLELSLFIPYRLVIAPRDTD